MSEERLTALKRSSAVSLRRAPAAVREDDGADDTDEHHDPDGASPPRSDPMDRQHSDTAHGHIGTLADVRHKADTTRSPGVVAPDRGSGP